MSDEGRPNNHRRVIKCNASVILTEGVFLLSDDRSSSDIITFSQWRRRIAGSRRAQRAELPAGTRYRHIPPRFPKHVVGKEVKFAVAWNQWRIAG